MNGDDQVMNWICVNQLWGESIVGVFTHNSVGDLRCDNLADVNRLQG